MTLGLLVTLGLLPGCAGKSMARESPLANTYEGDDILALERALAEGEQELRARDIHVPSATPATSPADLGGARDGGPVLSEDAGGDAIEEEYSTPEPEAAPATATADAPVADEPAPDSSDSKRVSRRDQRQSQAQCRQVCDLQVSICDLKSHICGLAFRHAGDPRYQNACSRASTDCEIATRACDDCS